jgi:hypothetical protein
MRRDDMREAIGGPARAAGLRVSTDLVDTILDDARDADGRVEFGTGALPLLSEAMRRLWEAQRDRPEGIDQELTSDAYAQSGKVADAVAKTADEVLESLGERERPLARALFLQLLSISPEGVTRESRAREKLKSALGPEVAPVIDAFVRRRLLIADDAERDDTESTASEGNSGTTVEIAHECLFWHWSALRTWIDEDRAVLARRGKLVNDAKEWKANEREPSFLYQGAKLAELEQEAEEVWASNDQRFPKLDELSEEFLKASRDHAAQHRRARRLTVSGLASLLVLALVAGFVTYTANRKAAEAAQALSDRESFEQSLALAEASAEAGLTDGSLAQLLAAAAWETAETDQAWAAMTSAAGNPATGMLTAGHGDGSVLSADFSADGTILATGGNDGSLAIWDTESWEAERLDVGWETGISELKVSPDGRFLAISAWSNNHKQADVQLLDTADESIDLFEAAFEDDVTIAFSPDGSMLAAAGSGQTKVWDLATRELLVTTESSEESVSQLAFAGPDDEIFATDSDQVQWKFDPLSNPEAESAVLKSWESSQLRSMVRPALTS